ncbi:MULTISPECIES: carbohydrate ABC transporter permease [unclassified Nocardioides]|uniref:carbohydrate ABC transporter permease n=1 Tax=unclassified Nocardioides TaxID=2615069 RepID=UPI0000571902|nr:MULTISPECIES: carbohydrate ABC transporter permease [unclassified Nocardioides]ABL83181.1 carbohydrate ABC transporter membrane protein 2, CUT1 family [Nocardioides sp. JS614]
MSDSTSSRRFATRFAPSADRNASRGPRRSQDGSLRPVSGAWATGGRLLLGGAFLLVALPLFWVVLGSFKSPTALNDPTAVVFSPTTSNWSAIASSGVLGSAGRSALVGLATVIISLVLGSMAAYSISRFKTGGDVTRFGILAAQVLPPAVLVFPFLVVSYNLRLNDTLVAVTSAHLSFVLPVVCWFLIGFFDAVPISIEEQAMVDGLTRFAAFRKVVLPQVAPGMGAAAIFGFVLSWNDLFYALILAPGNSATLPVTIASFNTFRGVELGAMCAAIVVSIVPVLIVSYVVQRRLVQGLAGGAVKF